MQNEKRPRKDSREQRCMTDRVRRGGGRLGVGKQWVEKQESTVSKCQSRRDTWEGGQHGADEVSLWSARNYREFTDEGLYFLLALVHVMRARGGVGWGQEEREMRLVTAFRQSWKWELTKVGLCSKAESLLKLETAFALGPLSRGCTGQKIHFCLGHFQSMAPAPFGVTS